MSEITTFNPESILTQAKMLIESDYNNLSGQRKGGEKYKTINPRTSSVLKVYLANHVIFDQLANARASDKRLVAFTIGLSYYLDDLEISPFNKITKDIIKEALENAKSRDANQNYSFSSISNDIITALEIVYAVVIQSNRGNRKLRDLFQE